MALAASLVLAACTSEEEAPFGTAEVTVEAIAQVISSPATVIGRTYAATVEAEARVDVVAPALGRIESLLVSEGASVRAGQPLAVVGSDAALLALRQAEAAESLARSGAAEAADRLRQSQESLPEDFSRFSTRDEEIAAELGAIEADLLRDPVTLAPSRRELVAQALALRAERDARAAVQRAAADGAAQRTQAELALAQARRAVADLTLRAPVDGVVRVRPDVAAGGGRSLVVGSDVAPGQPVVTVTGAAGYRVDLVVPQADLAPLEVGVTVAVDLEAFPGQPLRGTVRRIGLAELRTVASTDFIAEIAIDAPEGLVLRAGLTGRATLPELPFADRFEIQLEIDEIDVVLIELGQQVVVEVDALRDRPMTGTIVALAQAPERQPTGGTVYRARVRLDAPTGGQDAPPLRPGLTGTADIEVQRIADALTVPSTALLRSGGNEVVYVVRGGVAVEVPVRVRAFGDARAAIVGELVAGERVVTTGIERITAGTPVDVQGG